MKKLGVLIIRGSGGSGFDRQEKFIEKVNTQLAKSGVDVNQIAHEYIDWYGPLQNQQEILLERMFNHKELKLKSKLLRKFLFTNIADLINYGGKPNLSDDIYKKTQQLLHDSVVKLQSKVAENAPLVILASSMGTEVINNYIWDRQHPLVSDPFGNTAFERFETLVGLFTFGNNIPIFSSSTDVEDLRPIQFPAKNILPALSNLAVWENYYDKNDPLGYPIKFINEHYAAANMKDIQVGVGNLLSYWNILSHFGYWTSRKIRNRVSDFIKQVIEEAC